MSAPFSTTLGVRPDVIRLAPAVANGEADNAWTIRVHGAEAWDAVRVEALPATKVRDVKLAALHELNGDSADADSFVVKLGGVQVAREDWSLSEAGLRNGSTLLVMLRRRRAVR